MWDRSHESLGVQDAVASTSPTSSASKQPQGESCPPRLQVDKFTPQEGVNRFWSKFYSRHPGKVFTVLPGNPYAQRKIPKASKGVSQAQRALRSYDQAREECIRDVNRIIRECRRVNQKYRDPHFDIESDLVSGRRKCLEGLEQPEEEYSPKAVKRLTDIFENPRFFIHGPTAGDVVQGNDLGDCYLLAALCGLGGMRGLIDDVCVIHDQAIGVYGFVFHRDGEWQQCIIDDQLYLTAPDYDESYTVRRVWYKIKYRDPEAEYRRTHQTGSQALYFGRCSNRNETWLPLLEKAYAEAHGDYVSISGGWAGEATEDLTGGVTSELYTADILDKDAFWSNELLKVGEEFLYSCSTGFASWLESYRAANRRQVIVEGHVYSIIDAVEHAINGKTYRFVKVRNPWGYTGWSGTWTDWSVKWATRWMRRINHKFRDDGNFWMSYEDLLRKFDCLDRTRIFGPQWSITQQWTSVHVPWSADYHQTRFSVTVTRSTPVVIVLSQLDQRYFTGLEGQYDFHLQFRVQKADNDEDYIVRSNPAYYMTRSVSTDVTLEAGSYLVLMKVTATRRGGRPLDEIIADHVENIPEKLIQVGLLYDIAHAKGVIVETDQERGDREASAKASAAVLREKRKNRLKTYKENEWRRRERLARRETKRKRYGGFGSPPDVTRDEHHHEQIIEFPRPEHGDSYARSCPPGTDNGRSLTREITAAYEHLSAAPSPMASNTISSTNPSPTNGAKYSLRGESESDGGSVSVVEPERRMAEDTTAYSIPRVQVNGVDTSERPKAPKKRPAPLCHRAIAGGALEQQRPDLGHRKDQDETAQSSNSTPQSDTDSLAGLDWQTDLDYDSDEYNDLFRPGHKIDNDQKSRPPRRAPPSDGKEPAIEPWNAVCVVGLRVYSQDPHLSLQVVRPNPYSGRDVRRGEVGEEDDDNDGVGSLGILDRDDPAKGAAAEKWVKTPTRDEFGS